jgi:DNA polymerase IIIc chi subunit
VHFHGLPETPTNTAFPRDSEKDFFYSAVFLAQKLYEKNSNKKIALLCDPEDLNNLDKWLWTASPESFLPHSFSGFKIPENLDRADKAKKLSLQNYSNYLIYLTSDPKVFYQPQNMPDILIQLIHPKNEPIFNLDNPISLSHDPLEKTIEIHHIVGKNAEYREYCRTLFREYKKNGIKISYQEILPPALFN